MQPHRLNPLALLVVIALFAPCAVTGGITLLAGVLRPAQQLQGPPPLRIHQTDVKRWYQEQPQSLRCPRCKGAGDVLVTAPGGIGGGQDRCPVCWGTGEVAASRVRFRLVPLSEPAGY